MTTLILTVCSVVTATSLAILVFKLFIQAKYDGKKDNKVTVIPKPPTPPSPFEKIFHALNENSKFQENVLNELKEIKDKLNR